MREPRFEVLWYEGPTEFEAVRDDYRNANWKIIERIK